ncbi:MAG TPA: acyltransferase [Vicinamibacterales bacterium]|nr:acyltransferase [Vicinamibacterales bacterium]
MRRHYRELDSLRALAVVGVIANHYLPAYEWLGQDMLGEFGAAGVRLFFALSGFLITGILIDTRLAVRRGVLSIGPALGRFYARRCLRIFPLYFLIVVVCWAIGVEAVRRAPVAFATFTYNLHLIRQGWWDAHLSHFWSLSVEQQFYVVWPCLMLLLPRRGLVPAAVVSIVGAEIARWYYLTYEPGGMAFYVSTLAAGDVLGTGALLALTRRTPESEPDRSRSIYATPSMMIGLLACWAASPWWHPLVASSVGFAANVLRDGLELATFAGLIYHAALGPGGWLGAAATWRPLTYIGKISYGLYAYHPLMLPVSSALLAAAGVSAVDAIERGAPPVALALTLGTAAGSWHLFEKPVNDLKRYV